VSIIGAMRLDMDDTRVETIEQVRQFMEGSHGIEFKPDCREEKYEWAELVLVRFRYLKLGREDKGVVREYIMKVTDYSRAQASRLIGEYKVQGHLQCVEYRRHCFPAKYTPADMALLARTDELHDYLSGPATKRILEREYQVYGHQEFKNISGISVAHLYNVRKRNLRLGLGTTCTRTRPVAVPIGERAAPDPKGAPGYIRVDTVHQGDLDGQKGVYHINAVDQVTQWEVVASVQRISESHLVPVLEIMLATFPFVVRGFHSDNGSEFVNRSVARMLNRLLIRFTKCRPRHSNDNGLVESKNAAVVRKHLGYAHIPQTFSAQLNVYNTGFLNLYINFHRPCFFPVATVDAKGKVKKTYPYQEVKTPYERLKSLPNAEQYLAPGVTFGELDAIAHRMSDNEFAERMVKARSDLFSDIPAPTRPPPQAQPYQLIHSLNKERKSSKKKEMATAIPSVSFLD